MVSENAINIVFKLPIHQNRFGDFGIFARRKYFVVVRNKKFNL